MRGINMDFSPTNQECLRLKYHKKCAGETIINQMKIRFEEALRQKTEVIQQLEKELEANLKTGLKN